MISRYFVAHFFHLVNASVRPSRRTLVQRNNELQVTQNELHYCRERNSEFEEILRTLVRTSNKWTDLEMI